MPCIYTALCVTANVLQLASGALAQPPNAAQHASVIGTLKRSIANRTAQDLADIRALFARIVAWRVRLAGRAAFAQHTPDNLVFTAAVLLPIVMAYMVGMPSQRNPATRGDFPQILFQARNHYRSLITGDDAVPARAFSFACARHSHTFCSHLFA
jgi:hypothetical protein